MSGPEPAIEPWLAAVVGSHEHLAGTLAALGPDQLTAPSYASEWTIAQVLSHLGSGAEIFSLFLEAGSNGGEAPGMAEFEPIWERWNAKAPADQAADALVADRVLVDRLESLDPAAREAWHLPMFGADRGLSDVLRLRLGEHVVHTWDIDVTTDGDTVLPDDATALLIDTLDELVARTGEPSDPPLTVLITTSGPTRRLVLTVGGDDGAVSLASAEGSGSPEGAPTLELPAEALVRLVYGRLDPGHTPVVGGDRHLLDRLRGVFPGF